jgi:uncharacterized protein
VNGHRSLLAGTDTVIMACMLEMRDVCERCGVALAADADTAFICSYECTFCADCAKRLQNTCPNCAGVLRQRPARTN